jgi:hypothetical protein
MENPNAQHGISSTPPQNLYLLASAVNNIYSAITSAYGSPPSGMPPDIENIYNDITNTSSLMSGQSLEQLCFGGGLAAQDNLFNNLAGVNVILTGNGSGTPSLWTDMNTFFSDYSPPSTTDNSTINGDMYSLIEAIQSGNWSSVASTIQSLNTSLGSASPLDGFLATLQNLLNAPLDENNDTLLSLSSSSPPNTTELQSLLGPGGSLSSLFNSFSSDGSNGSMLGLILYWEGQG